MLENCYPKDCGYAVEMQVIRVYNGNYKNETVVIQPSWSNCDYLFNLNEQYYVFINQDQEGSHTTSKCLPNFSSSNEKRKKEFMDIVKSK